MGQSKNLPQNGSFSDQSLIFSCKFSRHQKLHIQALNNQIESRNIPLNEKERQEIRQKMD